MGTIGEGDVGDRYRRFSSFVSRVCAMYLYQYQYAAPCVLSNRRLAQRSEKMHRINLKLHWPWETTSDWTISVADLLLLSVSRKRRPCCSTCTRGWEPSREDCDALAQT
jgi:hypothetical protein